MKRRLPLPDLPQLVTAVLLIAVCRPIASVDLFWHLAAAREIVADRAMIHADLFSFTKQGAAWFYHEPLFGLAVYALHSAGGYALLILLKALLIAGFPALVSFLFRRKDQLLVVVAVAVWVSLAFRSFALRPQLFSFLLFALLLHALETRRLRWLPLVTLGWANLHGSFILGLAVVLLYAGWDLVRGALGRKRALLYAAALAAPALNPHFLSLYVYPFQYLGETIHSTYIAEWFAPTFAEYPHFFLIAPLVLLLYPVRVWHGRSELRSVLERHLPLFLTTCLVTYLGFTSVRHLPIAGIAFVFALRLAPDGDLLRAGRFLPARRGRPGWLLGVALAAAAVLSFRQPGLDPGRFPPDELLARVRERPELVNLFANYGQSGYLIWRLGPERRVFIDGRADMYGEVLMEDYVRIYFTRVDWLERMRAYPLDALILDSESPLLRHFVTERVFSGGGFHLIPLKDSFLYRGG